MVKGPVLTIASAGGHLTQALCIMRRTEHFHIVTSAKVELDVGAIAVHVIRDTQFNPFIHALNIVSAFRIIKATKPAAMFSTGGPICLPFAMLAKTMKIPFVYLDTLSRVQELSNSAKFLRRFNLADRLLTQWAGTAEKYPDIEYLGKTFAIDRMPSNTVPLAKPIQDLDTQLILDDGSDHIQINTSNT